MTRHPFLSINVLRLNELAIVPTYAHPGDAGADLYAVHAVTIPARGHGVVDTGIAIELPSGFVGLVHSRSGLAIKEGIAVVNSPGTIDSGYRGEIKVGLINHRDNDFDITPGMRIAQLVIQRVEHATFTVVSELNDSQRGDGGFGSTGLSS